MNNMKVKKKKRLCRMKTKLLPIWTEELILKIVKTNLRKLLLRNLLKVLKKLRKLKNLRQTLQILQILQIKRKKFQSLKNKKLLQKRMISLLKCRKKKKILILRKQNLTLKQKRNQKKSQKSKTRRNLKQIMKQKTKRKSRKTLRKKSQRILKISLSEQNIKNQTFFVYYCHKLGQARAWKETLIQKTKTNFLSRIYTCFNQIQLMTKQQVLIYNLYSK